MLLKTDYVVFLSSHCNYNLYIRLKHRDAQIFCQPLTKTDCLGTIDCGAKFRDCGITKVWQDQGITIFWRKIEYNVGGQRRAIWRLSNPHLPYNYFLLLFLNLVYHSRALFVYFPWYYSRGVARIFQRGGHRGYSPDHHLGIADFFWFIPLLSLLYQRVQSYYRGMKAFIN